jgi:hypothetical protein
MIYLRHVQGRKHKRDPDGPEGVREERGDRPQHRRHDGGHGRGQERHAAPDHLDRRKGLDLGHAEALGPEHEPRDEHRGGIQEPLEHEQEEQGHGEGGLRGDKHIARGVWSFPQPTQKSMGDITESSRYDTKNQR